MNSDPSMSRTTSITVPRAGNLKSAKGSNDSQSPDAGLIRALGGLKVWQKISLIPLVAAVPIAFLLYQFFTAQGANIEFAQQEETGAKYLTVAAKLLRDIPLHRGLNSLVLAGDQASKDRLAQTEAAIQSQFNELAAIDQQLGAQLKTGDAVSKLREGWNQLLTKSNSLQPTQSFAAHSKLIDEQLKPLLYAVSTNSNLILDPELEAYTGVDLAINNLVTFTENLGRLRGIGATVLLQRNMSQQQRLDMSYYGRVSDTLDAKMFPAIKTITSKFPEIGAKLTAANDAGEGPADTLREITNDIVLTGNLNYSYRDFLENGNKAVDAHIKLFNEVLIGLQDILQQRVDGLRQTQLIAGVIAGLALALLTLLTIVFVRSITSPVNEIVRVVRKFGQGDLSETVQIASRDELGYLASSFNESIERLRGLVSTEQERDNERKQREELQQNIGEFLNVTMDIAQGDMTKRGKVSDDVLGNVVDAINLMAEELGYVLKDVQGVANTVNTGANSMSVSSDSVLEGAAQQAREAATATTDTQNMAQSIRKMAQRATESATAATQTLTASQQGTEAVNNTLQGMQAIRREVSHISKGIKGLSDRSLEISEIVEAITSIASQTNLLALNAAIEASGAGEAGSRFAIVADEVRRLADDSAKAAARVGGLIKNVQTEIQELVSSVEGGTKEVEQGYRIATQAGERLREISDLANQSNALAQAISGATGQQVQGVERVAQAVSSIAATAQKTQEESSKGRETAEQLRNLSAQLSGTLDRFRLPA
jgi:twitching motility protein PilJ